MRREKGTRAPQPTVPLVLIFVQVFEHRFGKNAIAACSIIYENMRHRTDQLTVLQNGATAHALHNAAGTCKQLRVGHVQHKGTCFLLAVCADALKLRIKQPHTLIVDCGGDLYGTERFIDIKLSCREQMLQKLMDYDLAKGAEYATYIFPFIRDAMLRFRMGEEKWSVSSLTNYKMVRSMAWLYHNTKDAVNEFSKKYNCDLALAEEYLKVVRGIRNQQPFYVTDENGEETGEDVALDDSWNYTDILWNGIQAEKVQRAFEKLNYREQTLLEKRLAICMTCGRVSSWKDRPTFEELAVMFEGSTASGAERAYRKAVDKLTELLVAEGAIHAVRLKQKSKIKRKKKIAAAIYEYQADCDGEWGEISLDFENGKAEVILLADWDTVKTNKFASRAIAYLLNCENE